MNSLYNIAITNGTIIDKFLLSMENTEKEFERVLNMLSSIYGKDMRIINFINRELSIQTSVLTKDYKKDLSFLYKYIFLDKLIDKYRIVRFDEPNTQLVMSKIDLKIVYYGGIKDMKEKVILNYININYPLATLNKLYANNDNIEDIVKLVSSPSIIVITDDERVNTLYKLVNNNVRIIMIDNENYLYDVKKEFNKLTLEKIGW